ncbi:hypothetical protein [Streptomyces ardesiacus]|uniref:hypothetical protein n=1 Tax=Streptomyces ardesiacus TaxID=285564 RepID=UPI00201ED94E|nr:hypothetical protein [Streptomyces ardesiacus]MCL7370170.1 hypothetical protein [Streptomyces ardesiacus]
MPCSTRCSAIMLSISAGRSRAGGAAISARRNSTNSRSGSGKLPLGCGWPVRARRSTWPSPRPSGEGAMTVSERTRSGASTAMSWLSSPPAEWPTWWALSRPWAASTR